MQVTASNWMHLQILPRKGGYPSATGSKGCGTRLRATGIAFGETLYSISSELSQMAVTCTALEGQLMQSSAGVNSHVQAESLDQHCKLGQSLCSFKVAQQGLGLFAACLKVLSQGPSAGIDWAALRKSFGSAEANFHSCSYCYSSCTNKILLTKTTVTPNLSSTGTWKGNVFCHWET